MPKKSEKCFTIPSGKVVCSKSKGAKKNYNDEKVKCSNRKGTWRKAPCKGNKPLKAPTPAVKKALDKERAKRQKKKTGGAKKPAGGASKPAKPAKKPKPPKIDFKKKREEQKEWVKKYDKKEWEKAQKSYRNALMWYFANTPQTKLPKVVQEQRNIRIKTKAQRKAYDEAIDKEIIKIFGKDILNKK